MSKWPESREDDLISIDDLLQTVEAFKNCCPKDGLLRFYTSGTGVPDSLAINFYCGTNIIVVTRDGTEYLKGEKRGE